MLSVILFATKVTLTGSSAVGVTLSKVISYGASETVPCEFYGTGGEGDESRYGTSGQPLSESYG